MIKPPLRSISFGGASYHLAITPAIEFSSSSSIGGIADGVDAGRMELASPTVVNDGLFFITSDAYHRHRNKIMRTLASIRHTIVFGTGSAADKLRTLHSITKEYKFDAENFHFIKDA